jgi:hypothetical protein
LYTADRWRAAGEKAGLGGKWLEWRELKGRRKLVNFVTEVDEGGRFAKAAGFPTS